MEPDQTKPDTTPTGLAKHGGGCHCGDVRFEAMLDLAKGAGRCNCSICTKVGATATIGKPEAFTLLSDPANLGSYAWGPKISTRFFCKRCGIHVYGRGHLAEVGGDYVSVNLNCLDEPDLDPSTIHYWDGRHNNWQAGPRSTPWPVSPRAPAVP